MKIILGRFKNNKVFICAFLTACYTGMRTGEVFALTWNDIDLDNRIIKVNKTVYAKDKEENGRWYLGTAKTIGSHREIYICDTLHSFLLKYKELQNKVSEIMEMYPNLQLLFEDDKAMNLNEEECKMLQKLVSLYLQMSDYEDRKIFFLGARENYFYFKNLGIIKG